MLVGYVSDEFYVGIPNVGIEFTREGISVAIRSRTSGSVYANVEPGAYRVYLSREGFTPKWVDMEVRAGVIHHFRLLSDNISGYVWPKWVRSGDTGQVRLHSPRDAVVSLWRYGWEREFVTELGHLTDEPRGAYCQILPDGDVSRTGVRWSDHGYSYPEVDPLSGGGPESLCRGRRDDRGCTTSTPKTQQGPSSRSPGSWPLGNPACGSRCWPPTSTGTPTTTTGAGATTWHEIPVGPQRLADCRKDVNVAADIFTEWAPPELGRVVAGIDELSRGSVVVLGVVPEEARRVGPKCYVLATGEQFGQRYRRSLRLDGPQAVVDRRYAMKGDSPTAVVGGTYEHLVPQPIGVRRIPLL